MVSLTPITRAWRLLLAAVALAASDGALAQTAQQFQVQSDINAARASAIDTTFSRTGTAALQATYGARGSCLSTFAPKPTSNWAVAAGAQTSYDSNPAPGTSDSGDWHAHPDLKTGYQWQGPERLEAVLDVNSDRYLSTSAANRDEASLQTKLSLSDGRDCTTWNLFFYLNNKYTDDFAPTFSQSTSRFDILTAGMSGSFPFRIIRGAVERTSVGDSDYLLSFDLSAGRQQSMPTTLNGNIAVLSATLSASINDSWAMGLTPSLKATWRDSSAGHALLSANALVVKWTPAVPDAFDRKLEIDLVETFSSNHSSTSGSSFTQNDIGPSLTWTWKF
jgi:hypothetical protein